jgi:hypothetical protein
MRTNKLTQVVAVTLALAVSGGSTLAQAQQAQQEQRAEHVVSLGELNTARGAATETRQSDEAAVRHLFNSEAGQKALRSASIDYAKVDKAVGQLSDEDVARLATRSRQMDRVFSAGSLSDRDLLVIVIIAVLIIALIAALH